MREAPLVRKQGLQLLLVIRAVLGQSFVQQPLVGFGLRQPAPFAELPVGGRHARIQAENAQQQELFPLAQLKDQPALCRLDQFHSSRSIVACRLYF